MYIETDRLIIRSMQETDGAAFMEMVADGSLNEDIFCGYEGDYHDWVKEWIAESILLDKENNPNKDYLAYAIVKKSQAIPVGSIGCSFYEESGEIGITYFIGTPYRGYGYATEAVMTYTEYFFNHYDVLFLTASVRTENVASCKVMEKAGFYLTETKMFQDFGDTQTKPYNFYRRNRHFYHVVTERPMHLGQHILFDETHHSGVYERVMEKASLVETIYAHPEKYADTGLDYAGNYLEHHTTVALRELALEEVRKEKYPMYPSRLSCLYISKTLSEAENWFAYFTELGRPTYQIVKLRVNGNVFAGDANKCFAGCPDKQINLRLAERYWKNETEPEQQPPVIEILVDGDIEVVEIIKE